MSSLKSQNRRAFASLNVTTAGVGLQGPICRIAVVTTMMVTVPLTIRVTVFRPVHRTQ